MECKRWLVQLAVQAETILRDYDLWKDVVEITFNSPVAKQSSEFHPWLDRSVSCSILVGVRRLVYATRKDDVTLMKLLSEVKAQRKVGSTEVERDIKELNEAAKAVKIWVDKRVAHCTRHDPPKNLTHGELREAMGAIERVILKYEGVFGCPQRLHNTLRQQPDDSWKCIFREAWLPRQQS